MRNLTLILSGVAFLVLVTVLWVYRAKPIKVASVAAQDWQRTEEVTLEASTGRTLRIWIDPSDGSRHAVAERR